MNFIGGMLDRVILLLGVMAGGCAPSFISQYQQRVGGRLDQVLHDLAPFQAIADRHHGGSLDALIQHHLNSSDPTFYEEGAAIRAMVESVARLREALAGLDTDVFNQMLYLAQHYDPDIVNATLSIYQPAFVISAESLMVAGILGLSVWLLFVGIWRLLAFILR